MKTIGCGRRNRTFSFGFKARRVAGYTIPQQHCRLPIFDCQLKTRMDGQSAIGNRKSAMSLVAAEGIEPSSLDYRSSALPLSYTAKVVDPTGLKPAPHGLKGRRSVTRAPGQEHFRLPIADCRFAPTQWCFLARTPIGNRQSKIGNDLAVAEGFEPSHGRINSAVPYQLGYATKNSYRTASGSERVPCSTAIEDLNSRIENRDACCASIRSLPPPVLQRDQRVAVALFPRQKHLRLPIANCRSSRLVKR